MAGLFLDQWAALSGVPHHTLVRIHPETRAIKANVFAWPSEREGALKWIEASNKTMNVYFSVNRARPINKKAEKCDIEALVAVHADVDPIDGADFCAERMRLMRLAAELAEREPAPTFILDSGGGIQAFYLTSYPTPADPPEYVAHIEGLSARLGCVLGARDRCWNVDRIMRLPATLNHPNKKKQARGQTPTIARMLHSSGATHTWHAIGRAVCALEDEPLENAEPVEHRARVEGGRAEWHSSRQVGDLSSDAPHWFDQLYEQRQFEEVERMLDHLTDPQFGTNYDLWLKISIAVYRATDTMGFEIWDAWCRALPGYDAAENLYKWNSGFREHERPATVGSLISLARERGYTPPDAFHWAFPTLDPEDLARLNAIAAGAAARERTR
jgi:hypothetical protein